jgi:hypothetical protein
VTQRLGAQQPIHIVDGGVKAWGELGQPLAWGAPAGEG